MYIAKLERPVKVTHLLCSGDEETDKMCYAETQLVWQEWFWDSLHFGGRFEEATYQVRRPRPEPKPVLASMSDIGCLFLCSHSYLMQLLHRRHLHQTLVPSMTSLLHLLHIAHLNGKAKLQAIMTKPRMNPHSSSSVT